LLIAKYVVCGLKNVPQAKYTLKICSEDGKVAPQAVEVSAGSATADLTVKRQEIADPESTR
jgi:hypothetical protein